MVDRIKIGGRLIGKDSPVFLIAEISCNHLQKKEHALKLIEEAKAAGADAVKFQTFTPNTITLDVHNDYFKIKGTIWEGRNLYDLYKEAYAPWEWFSELKDKSGEEGLIFFSTPSDETSTDFLDELGVPAYKVASFEINHLPMLRRIASKKKPVMLSTGVSTKEDIELALDTIRKEGNDEIAILKSTSAYPSPLKEMNLKTITDLHDRFGVVPGLSDHSLGITVPVVAVSLGAKIIEKHLMLDKKLGGPDSAFSLEPHEFSEMVKSVREAEEAMGSVSYELTEKVKQHRIFMRSIFVAEDMKPGEVFTKENIRIVRPGNGLHPRYYEEIIGKKARGSIKKGTPLSRDMVG